MNTASSIALNGSNIDSSKTGRYIRQSVLDTIWSNVRHGKDAGQTYRVLLLISGRRLGLHFLRIITGIGMPATFNVDLEVANW